MYISKKKLFRSIPGFLGLLSCMVGSSQSLMASERNTAPQSANSSEEKLGSDPLANPFNDATHHNVYVFDSATQNMTDIQATINNIYETSKTGQFSGKRVAFLFMPGNYNLDIKVGYYTSVIGLGKTPDEVVITGAVETELDSSQNSTENFWRSMENIKIIPTGGNDNWSVSQAAPIRRVHVQGNLHLSISCGSTKCGYASGGFMADSKIENHVYSGSQQQWISRNDTWLQQWTDKLWFLDFIGTDGELPTDTTAISHIDKTPLISEKPFLVYNTSTTPLAPHFEAVVPLIKKDSHGAANWEDEYNQANKIPINDSSSFFIAFPSNDPVANSKNINDALNSGKNIILTPGIYPLSENIKVTKSNTVIYGLGMPTLIPVSNK